MSPVLLVCGCGTLVERKPCPRCRVRNAAKKTIRNSAHWQRARRQARQRDGDACQRCGRTSRLGVHHVQPLGFGGDPYDLDNLITLCRRCHYYADSRHGGSVRAA